MHVQPTAFDSAVARTVEHCRPTPHYTVALPLPAVVFHRHLVSPTFPGVARGSTGRFGCPVRGLSAASFECGSHGIGVRTWPDVSGNSNECGATRTNAQLERGVRKQVSNTCNVHSHLCTGRRKVAYDSPGGTSSPQRDMDCKLCLGEST